MSSISNPNARPILALTLHPRDSDEGMRLKRALSEISEKDPALRFDVKAANDQFIVAGMSESHLDRTCDAFAGRYAIKFEASEPRVIYLETIRRSAEAEGKYLRQTGGLGNYGHCWLRVEPNGPGKGYEFINQIRADQVPNEYIGSINQGAQSAMENGILAGFPIVDVKVVLFGGSYHETDSNETAFKFAGSIAFKDAAKKASPILLEPMMKVEADVPEELAGALIDDINSRRGRIGHMSCTDAWCEIKVIVPLAEVLSCSTHGRLNYPMQFADYEPVTNGGWPEGGELGVAVNNPKKPTRGRGFEAEIPNSESN